MKVSKMMIHYTLLFSVPTAVALYFYNPKSDEQIRKDVVRPFILLSLRCVAWEAHELAFDCSVVAGIQEKRIRPDENRRKQHQQKYAELLLGRGSVSDDSKKQLDDVTSFTRRE